MGGAKRIESVIKDVAHMRAPRGSARSLIILGCQRSGTNALLGCFDHDRDAKVFPEFSELNVPSGKLSANAEIRFTVRLRPLDQVAARINRLRYPLAVLKPLVESRYVGELLEGVPRSRVIWLFRHYQDVAESNARTFGVHIHRDNLAPIAASDPSNWRSEGVSTEVRETVARHYRPDMDPIDGGALFWWARNRLLFDEGYESDPRVRPLQYARFVADPANVLAELYEHAGVAFPGEDIARSVTAKFAGRGTGPGISPDIHGLCEQLWERLLDLDRWDPRTAPERRSPTAVPGRAGSTSPRLLDCHSPAALDGRSPITCELSSSSTPSRWGSLADARGPGSSTTSTTPAKADSTGACNDVWLN